MKKRGGGSTHLGVSVAVEEKEFFEKQAQQHGLGVSEFFRHIWRYYNEHEARAKLADKTPITEVSVSVPQWKRDAGL